MKARCKSTPRGVVPFVVALVVAGVATSPLSAKQQWEASVGAQNSDLGSQILAFFPNEFWIHAGDSIRFTFASNEQHAVSFLTTGQIRLPPFALNGVDFVGCPG